MKKMSVVTATYNRKEDLGRLYSSIAKQKGLSDFEIIVVDDGSKDGSSEYVRKKFPFVKIIIQPKNGGKCKALNTGFAAASCKFVASFDSDVILDDKSILSKMLGAIEGQTDFDILMLNGKNHKDPSDSSYADYAALHPLPKKGCEWVDTVFFCGSGFAMRKKVWTDCKGFDDGLFIMAEELDFSFNAWNHGYRTVFFPKMFYSHNESMSGRPSGRSDYYLTRNLMWIYWRYLPLPHLAATLFGSWVFLYRFTTRNKAAALKGFIDGVIGIPHQLSRRQPVRWKLAIAYLQLTFGHAFGKKRFDFPERFGISPAKK